MKKINKLTKLFGVLGVASLSAVSSASAQGTLENVFPSDLSNLNFNDLINFIFTILLAAAVLWVVFNIVMAGIKIAGAKEDADKRKEGLKSIVNAAIGLVVALSAFAIVQVLRNAVGDDQTREIGIPCKLDDGSLGILQNNECIEKS